MPELTSQLLERAFRVAARHHDGDCRKSTDIPYLMHPCAVALVLVRAGIDADQILAAALLHDVVEDTDCTLDELAREFPPDVVAWVAATSEEKSASDGTTRPWIDRKQDHLKQIVSSPWQARAITLADKIHNLSSILFDLDEGAEVWNRFNASAEQVLWYNEEMLSVASRGGEPQLEPLRVEGQRLLQLLKTRIAADPS